MGSHVIRGLITAGETGSINNHHYHHKTPHGSTSDHWTVAVLPSPDPLQLLFLAATVGCTSWKGDRGPHKEMADGLEGTGRGWG